jgi:RNA polymerase sigma factor (sigma-70 family)
MTRSDFERLASRHKDAVYRHMLRVCNHREDAEDALATALLHAFRAHGQLGSDEAFLSWLNTIARRVCTRMRSHPSVQAALEDAERQGVLTDLRPELDLAFIKSCVKEAVDSLPPIYRDIYVACELNEMTVAEAARSLNISLSAAKSRLLRARAMVRSRLDSSVCAA